MIAPKIAAIKDQKKKDAFKKEVSCFYDRKRIYTYINIYCDF